MAGAKGVGEAPSAKSDSHHRFVVLDGLRGIAAIMVMIYHYTLNLHVSALSFAFMAVDFFFVLSGFVVAQAYLHRIIARRLSFATFMLLRLNRLGPTYLLSLFIAIPIFLIMVIDGRYSRFEVPQAIWASALNSVFIPYLNSIEMYDFGFATPGYIFPTNSSAWSLFYELVVNAVFFVGAALIVRHLRLLTALAVAFFVLGVLFLQPQGGFHAGWSTFNFAWGFPRALSTFLMGVLVHMAVTDTRYGVERAILQRLTNWRILRNQYTLCLLLALLLAWPWYPHGFEAVMCFILAPALVWAGANLTVAGATGITVARLLGALSYPLYCLHIPVWRCVRYALDYFGGGAYRFPAYEIAFQSIVTIALSVAVANLYDAPIRARLRQCIRSRTGSVAV